MIGGRAVPRAEVITAYEKVRKTYIYDRALTPEPIKPAELLKKWTEVHEAEKRKFSQNKKGGTQRGKQQGRTLTTTTHAWGHLRHVPKPVISTLNATVIRRNGIKEWLLQVGDQKAILLSEESLATTDTTIELPVLLKQQFVKGKPTPKLTRIRLKEGALELKTYDNLTITPTMFMTYVRGGFRFDGCANLYPGNADADNSVGLNRIGQPGRATPNAKSVSQPGRATPLIDKKSLGAPPS